jgi:hypothetical protein
VPENGLVNANRNHNPSLPIFPRIRREKGILDMYFGPSPRGKKPEQHLFYQPRTPPMHDLSKFFTENKKKMDDIYDNYFPSDAPV